MFTEEDFLRAKATAEEFVITYYNMMANPNNDLPENAYYYYRDFYLISSVMDFAYEELYGQRKEESNGELETSE